MIAAPVRRCKKVFPVILFFATIVIVIIWRLFQIQIENEIHPRHIFRDNNQEEYIDKNGIKVVVGHYVGNPVHKIPNASYDMINKVNFNPKPEKGKNGVPVIVEPKDLLVMQQLFQINRFNLLASDQIPLNRSLPDFRRKKCSTLYKDFVTYPRTSIIIVFHNEAWSTLLRTVWSVINSSPKELVEEIILVDDASEREYLKKSLEDYIQNLPLKTRILRSAERIGLIKARLKGAREAKGEVLTFLDAHCECTIGWLESLLSVIKADRKTVVCPVIDIINDETFAYVKSFELHWGAFNWNLQFRWFTLGGREIKLRKNDATQPFNSPTMAGGLFAMDKKFFYELGSYDEDMNVWGGENLEMSFRVWQCGGKIQIAPCSRVGHVFRKSSPYSFPGGINKTLFSNLARVALVWLDDWGNFYFKFNELARNVKDAQNVTARKELRRRLQCKSFEWYLDNIWPQHFFPKDDRFFGRIRNVGENMCLIKPDRKVMSNQPMGLAKIEKCLVRIMACSGYNRQKWEYDNKTKELRHISNHKCLDVSESKKFTEGLVINDCNGKKSQQWSFDSVLWK
ncbi:hypothetical protein NQ318_021910 [Aromia moschata]|uniref:Polypeptide N-acetylgalactosaminyltransferase n=1 Tax=Aromia moschata TaxID=1265417 RepID=A0AAV8Z8V2_9CUCU|nr:hypothetical protein NQ318_021910 [Aromia moschata]